MRLSLCFVSGGLFVPPYLVAQHFIVRRVFGYDTFTFCSSRFQQHGARQYLLDPSRHALSELNATAHPTTNFNSSFPLNIHLKFTQVQGQVRGAMRQAPRWQTLSRDYRFWLGLVVALSLVSSIISASGRSHDLVVWNDVLGSEPFGFGEALFAHAALVAATTAHSAGDAATQLAETGAAIVFA